MPTQMLKSAATTHTALTPRDHPPPMNYASPTPRHVQNPAFPTQRESFSDPCRQRPARSVPGLVPPLSLSPLPTQTRGGPWHLSGQCQGPVGSLPSRSLLPPRRAPTPAARRKRSELGEREKACTARVQNSQSPRQDPPFCPGSHLRAGRTLRLSPPSSPPQPRKDPRSHSSAQQDAPQPAEGGGPLPALREPFTRHPHALPAPPRTPTGRRARAQPQGLGGRRRKCEFQGASGPRAGDRGPGADADPQGQAPGKSSAGPRGASARPQGGWRGGRPEAALPDFLLEPP